MANSTSASLKLTVQATGENSGTWGQITNTNLLILEQAIGGFQSVAITTHIACRRKWSLNNAILMPHFLWLFIGLSSLYSHG